MEDSMKSKHKYKKEKGPCIDNNAISGGAEYSGIMSDNPITRTEDDRLGRAILARSFARQVLSLDTSNGMVVGVLGAWGSGKTSFINLARNEFSLSEVLVIDFNPWLFSGTEQLVQYFFVELSSQLKIRQDLADIGEAIEAYGEMFSGMVWLPVVGPWFERFQSVVKILGKIFQRGKKSINEKRKLIIKKLAALNKKIIIIIDDIDRLSTQEVKDIFKLVRLIANFPNLIYVVAFDRNWVEQALKEQEITGREYLEKILQVAIDLPYIPEQMLGRQILNEIDNAIKGIDRVGPFDDEIWPDIFMEIIRPLIRNMRDVRRYALGVRYSVSTLNGEIALPDVLALEAIRIFLPDVFTLMYDAIEALTTSKDSTYEEPNSQKYKDQIERLISSAKGHEQVMRDMIERLFPAASDTHYGQDWKNGWLRERRIAHENILYIYFERVISEAHLVFLEAEKAWKFMNDRDSLDRYLRSLEPSHLEDVISQLEVFEDKINPEYVIPATIVLLNLLPDLPEKEHGMFGFDSHLIVSRVTYRLIRSLKQPTAVEEAVKIILPEVKSLSSKRELIDEIGHVEGLGHKLVTAEAAIKFEREWVEEVKSTKVEDLIKEKRLLRIFRFVKKVAEETGDDFKVIDAPELTLALLENARSQTVSQVVGNRSVKREPRLSWDSLINIYGDEEILKDRIEKLKSIGLNEHDDLFTLADKYIAGWRPQD